MRHLELFAGIGGFRQALELLTKDGVMSFQNIGFSEIDKNAVSTYKSCYNPGPEELELGDIVAFTSDYNNILKLQEFDLLTGGFPCQAFSMMGHQKGFGEGRGQMFFRIVDILQDHPECNYVVLENVRNLADKENDWKVVCDELKALGFVITEEPIIESPHKFGIPQVRDRVYILGVKEAAIKTEVLREKGKITRDMLDIDSHYKACPKNCIPMLLDAVADPKYYVPDELVAVLDIWEEFLQNVKGVKSPFWLHKAGLGIYDDEQYKNDPVIGYQDMPDWKKEMVWRTRVMYNNNYEFIDDWAKRHKMTERSLIHQKFEWNASRDCTTIKQGITQFRQSGVRVKNPDYFPSLVAMNNTPIVWDTAAERYRYLSPHEAAKLQSFKDDFIFNESDPVSYRQLGNSVNVKLVRMFAEALLNL